MVAGVHLCVSYAYAMYLSDNMYVLPCCCRLCFPILGVLLSTVTLLNQVEVEAGVSKTFMASDKMSTQPHIRY